MKEETTENTKNKDTQQKKQGKSTSRKGQAASQNKKKSAATSQETGKLKMPVLVKEANAEQSTAASSRTQTAKGSKKLPVLVKEGKQSAQAAQPTAKGQTPEKKQKRAKNAKCVKVIFLGGVGEIGKNMTAVQYGDDILVIDVGITFPDEEMPGIDLVAPDITYLVENRDKIKGILLTHGHEDHIGSLPYLLKEINPKTPIYATKLTHMLADNKLKEHRINDTVQKVVQPKDVVKIGCFEVEFINVTHSIAGALALAIRTPQGLIFHTGDFKIDLTPVAGDPIDLERIAELGKEGVLLMLGESTNIERPGYTMSERVVGTTLDHLFGENPNRRLLIATFASNVHRLQQIFDLAVKYRRKVALSGRSMLNVVDAAIKIGELHIQEGLLVDVEKAKNYFDREIVILCTGSQGEPMSALTRMAAGDFNKVTIGANDTIIISANPIPGNEKMVYRVINNLYQRGANVVYESLESIHVSGHACLEEHKIIHSLLNPKFFIPVHGEYRHLKRHAALAEDLGMKSANILIPEIGSCVELTEKSMKFGESVPAGSRLIDGAGFEDLGTSEVMKDRKRMAAEGLYVISAIVSGGYVVGDVIVQKRGIVTVGDNGYEKEIGDLVERTVENLSAQTPLGDTIAAVKKAVKNYLFKKTKGSPLLVVTLSQI